MKLFKLITADTTHENLLLRELHLKECIHRAFRQNYTIVYPDNETVINVEFNKKN